jgi:hypothetical protein
MVCPRFSALGDLARRFCFAFVFAYCAYSVCVCVCVCGAVVGLGCILHAHTICNSSHVQCGILVRDLPPN